MTDELDLDWFVNLLHAGDIPAFIEQTGGGCATVYAGVPYRDADSRVRYPCVAGPGWFEGRRWTQGRASVDEFTVGPDDDGDTTPYYATEADDEVTLAAVIAQMAARTA
jgi:hypothetical protein